METLTEIVIYLIKLFAFVAALLVLFSGIMAITNRSKGSDYNKLRVEKLNDYYDDLRHSLRKHVFGKKILKKVCKQEAKNKKNLAKQAEDEQTSRKRVFVIDFKGDIKASGLDSLRQEITAILDSARKQDEVVCRLESPGGMVHTYGLAASQLARLRSKHIPLTVCVDKVAASGGYLMAAIADTIVAAPYAIVGSIGVVAQMPNFNRFLKKHYVDYELLTAGEYKRTLSVLGPNTNKGRKKFLEELEAIHTQFKNTIEQYRPQVDVDKVATGEHWLAEKAYSLKLVDTIATSDDYLLSRIENCDVYHISMQHKKKLSDKVMHFSNAILTGIQQKTYDSQKRWWS